MSVRELFLSAGLLIFALGCSGEKPLPTPTAEKPVSGKFEEAVESQKKGNVPDHVLIGGETLIEVER